MGSLKRMASVHAIILLQAMDVKKHYAKTDGREIMFIFYTNLWNYVNSIISTTAKSIIP